MSMSGALIGDFSSFDSAVKGSITTLKTFEDGAATAGTRLTTMENSLSGVKIVQQAALAAEAVERIGGVSKLTEAELARVGATAIEAAAKLRAMGQDVPPGIQQIADAAKNATGGFQTFGQQVAATALGFVSAQAIMAVVKETIHAVVDEFETLTLHGAAVADVSDNFDHLTAQIGRSGEALLGTLKTGTHQTIDDFELMKLANKDLTAGMVLTDAQFGTLAKGAFALAQATGGSVKDGLDAMNDAMLTGRTRAVALLTGKIDLVAAEEKFAARLGTTKDKLSEEQKLEADRAAILDSVTAATARLGDQTDGLDERVAQAQTAWTNFEDSLGKTIATSPVLAAGLDRIGVALSEAFGGDQQKAIDGIAGAVNNIALKVVDAGIATGLMAGEMVQAWSLIQVPILAVETLIVGLVTTVGEVLLKADQLAGKLHLVDPDEYKRIEQTQIGLRAMTVSLAEQTAEAGRGVIGQSALNRTIDAGVGVLLTTRDAMIAAGTATAGAVKPTKDLTDGTTALGGAMGATTGPTKEQAAAIDKAAEAMARLTKAQQDHIAAIADHLFGADDIKAATDMAAALGRVENVSMLTAAAQKEVATKMEAGRDAMIAQGLSTDALTGLFEQFRLAATATGRDAAAAVQAINDEAKRGKDDAASLAAAYVDNFVVIGHKASEVAAAISLSFSQAVAAASSGAGTLVGTIANAPLTEHQHQITQDAWNQGNYYGPVVGGSQGNPKGSGPDFKALGYERGGPTVEGPSYMHEGEYVVPKDGALVVSGGESGGGGTTIVQLVVDGKVLASIVNEQNTRTMKQGRKWPSA